MELDLKRYFPISYNETTGNSDPDSDPDPDPDRDPEPLDAHPHSLELYELMRIVEISHTLAMNSMLLDVLNLIEQYYIDSDSVVELLMLAVHYDISSLKEKCMSFAAQNVYIAAGSEVCQLKDMELYIQQNSKNILGFECLPTHIQLGLYTLQRCFVIYRKYEGCSGLISCREVISIVAECLEEDQERYNTAFDRLHVEIEAYKSKLHAINQFQYYDALMDGSYGSTGTSSSTSSSNNDNTGAWMHSGVGEYGDISIDLLQWRDRIKNVENILIERKCYIELQKQFYKEQKHALTATASVNTRNTV